MLISPSEAQALFETLPEEMKAPSLSPEYVTADSLRDASLEPLFWVYHEGNDFLYHPFHMAQIPGARYRDIQSAYGYGGPVATSEDPGFLGRADCAFREWCREEGIIAGFFRFHPLLSNWRFFQGEVIRDRTTLWIDLRVPDLLASYKRRHKYEIKIIQKRGCKLICDKSSFNMDMFFSAYNETMKIQNANQFYFINSCCVYSFILLKNALFLTLWDNDVFLSGGIFLHTQNILEYHLSGSTLQGREMSATKLLIHLAAEWGKSKGIRYFHLGGGSDSSEQNLLLFFKRGFSNLETNFYIGKQVYIDNVYEEMKIKSGKTNADKVLFYRF